jgi:phosphoglycolate phosphatase
MKTQAILFDLDGTLVNTAPDLIFALNQLLIKENLKEVDNELAKRQVAYGAKALIKLGFGIKDGHSKLDNLHQQFLQIYTNNIVRNSDFFPNVLAFVDELVARGIAWGVVTNKPENLTFLLLEQLKFYPEVVVCGDTLKFSKPHPAPLLFACAQLAVLPERCLFVGDDKNDMLAGKNAKITAVAVGYGYGEVKESWGYDYLIQDISELKKWI